MNVFKNFPKCKKCPICGTNNNRECVLIGIDGTQKGNNIEANCYHLDCIDLIEVKQNDKVFIYQVFEEKMKNDNAEH